MESWLTDLRHSLRILRQSPSFTIAAVAALAIGIAANTAIFTVVNTVILRPLPFADSDRMVNIGRRGGGTASIPMFTFWERHNPGFEDLAAYLPGSSMNLNGGERAGSGSGDAVLRGITSRCSGPIRSWAGISRRRGPARRSPRAGDELRSVAAAVWRRSIDPAPDHPARRSALRSGWHPFTRLHSVPTGRRLDPAPGRSEQHRPGPCAAGLGARFRAASAWSKPMRRWPWSASSSFRRLPIRS